MLKLKSFISIIWLLSLALTINACGIKKNIRKIKKAVDIKLTSSVKRKFETSDEAFASYVDYYQEVASMKKEVSDYTVTNIPINFGDTGSPDYKGVCLTYSNNLKEIIIDKAWWDGQEEARKELLIFHELGHCDLNRHTHSDEEIEIEEITYKKSLMNKNLIPVMDYVKLKDYYHTELFTP